MAHASETYLGAEGASAPAAPAVSANGAPSSTYLSPDQAVAPSPIPSDSEYAFSRRGLTADERTSRASSIRLSRDLDTLLWNGSNVDDSDFGDDYSFLKPGDDADMLASDDSRRASMLDGTDTSILSRQDTGELNSYSALSKRADFILASAKRKLNLLEGDIKGARHSLLAPPRSSHALTPSNSLRIPVSTYRPEENGLYSGNSRPSYTSSMDRDEQAQKRALYGHTRVFSETSVPSPRGPAVKGSLGLEHVRNRYPLQKHSTDFNNDRSLGPVIEDEVSTEWDDDDDGQATAGQTDASSAVPNTNAQILRNEAEDLRGRLTQIQERVLNDARKRRSLQGPRPDGSSRDLSIASQIQALKQSLDQQEEVIEQLERAEEGEPIFAPGSHTRDPREEWQQILEHDEERYDEDANSLREYSDEEADDDDDADFQSVLEQQQFEQEDPDMDGAHEDRADAFDYEHFILHSVLGNYGNTSGSRSASTSTRSNSTERGDEEQDLEDEGTDSAYEHPRGLHHEESVASFATAQQGTDESNNPDSNSDIDTTANDETQSIRDKHGNSWPLPPSSNGSRHTSTVFSESGRPTPTGNGETDKINGKSPSMGHRPASRIFAALMSPMSTASALPTLDEDDQTIVYGLAEALRHACVKLQRNPASEQGGLDWRQKLEEARKILADGPDLPS